MKISRSHLLFLTVLAQILFFYFWYFSENAKLENPKSKEILVKILPSDPRDLLSGNYFILRYSFSDISAFSNSKNFNFSSNTEVYAILEEENGYFKAKFLSRNPEKITPNQVMLKGKSNKRRIDFGIEKFFINENQKEPKFSDKIEALLIVDENGSARIKKLFVNSLEF
jgi:uncharacterized membrane-anchored protein